MAGRRNEKGGRDATEAEGTSADEGAVETATSGGETAEADAAQPTRPATAADEEALPVVEVSAGAGGESEEPAAAPESASEAKEEPPPEEPPEDAADAEEAPAEEPKAEEEKAGEAEAEEPAPPPQADDATVAAAAASARERADEQHEEHLEHSGVIEMKSPDSPEFSLLERSVLISAPEEEVEEEDPLAGLSKGQRAMRWLSPRLLGLVLLLLGGAGVAGTFVTLLHPFRDWFMHLLMYSVIFAFFLLYLKAHARRRPILRYLMMFVTSGLAGFFAWILADYIPAQKVWYARSVLWREEVGLLWLPMGLLIAAAVLLLFHCVVVARFASRRA